VARLIGVQGLKRDALGLQLLCRVENLSPILNIKPRASTSRLTSFVLLHSKTKANMVQTLRRRLNAKANAWNRRVTMRLSSPQVSRVKPHSRVTQAPYSIYLYFLSRYLLYTNVLLCV
jgi:hypothetical protein